MLGPSIGDDGVHEASGKTLVRIGGEQESLAAAHLHHLRLEVVKNDLKLGVRRQLCQAREQFPLGIAQSVALRHGARPIDHKHKLAAPDLNAQELSMGHRPARAATVGQRQHLTGSLEH